MDGECYMCESRGRTCFFIGHRNAPESVQPLLDAAIEQHITDYGVTDFVVGHYGAFDRMASAAAIRAKQRHPEVALILLLPFHPFERPIDTPEGFGGTFYPPDMEAVPRRFAIIKANEYMIRHCDYLIAYDKRLVGKTRDFVDLARRLEAKGLLRVDNLADDSRE